MTPTGKPRYAERIAPQVAELVAAGHGRNTIAKMLGCAVGTVTVAARVAGVTFDHTVPDETREQAKTSRQLSTAERREATANGWSGVAGRAIAQLVKALDAGQIEPKHLATVAGIATDKWLKLLPEADPDTESQEEAARALNELIDAIHMSRD